MAKSPVRPVLQRPARAVRGVGLIRFIKEVANELRKAVWPSRQEATRLTIFVIIIAAAIGIFLGLIDIGFTQLFNRFVLR